MILKLYFFLKRVLPISKRKEKGNKGFVASLFLWPSKVLFNEHISFMKWSAFLWIVLCSHSDNCLVYFSDPQFYIPHSQNAGFPKLFSWSMLPTFVSSLQRARHLERITPYNAAHQDLRTSRDHCQEGPYPIQWWVVVEFRSCFCHWEPQRLLGIIVECRRNLYHLWSEQETDSTLNLFNLKKV